MVLKSSLYLFAAVILLGSCGDGTPKADSGKGTVFSLNGTVLQSSAQLIEQPLETKLKSPVKGTIEALYQKKHYRKGEVIIRFSNQEEFRSYEQDFQHLHSSLQEAIDHFSPAMDPVKDKWAHFLNSLDLTRAPETFPRLEYKEEAGALEEFNVIVNYKQVLTSYLHMEDYFVRAPGDGFVYNWKTTSGKQLNHGTEIGTFYPSVFQIRYQSDQFIDSNKLQKIKTFLEDRKIQVLSMKNETTQIALLHVRISHVEQRKTIPLEIPTDTPWYRFVIPEKQIKNGTFQYSQKQDLSKPQQVSVKRINSQYMVNLRDSVVYYSLR